MSYFLCVFFPSLLRNRFSFISIVLNSVHTVFDEKIDVIYSRQAQNSFTAKHHIFIFIHKKCSMEYNLYYWFIWCHLPIKRWTSVEIARNIHTNPLNKLVLLCVNVYSGFWIGVYFSECVSVFVFVYLLSPNICYNSKSIDADWMKSRSAVVRYQSAVVFDSRIYQLKVHFHWM